MQLLARPGRARDLGVLQWDGLLRVARKEKLLSRLGAILGDDPALLADCPAAVREMFRAAQAYPLLVQARALWEVREVLAATSDLAVDFILLKGVAYLHLGLTLAKARTFADVDVLVPETELPGVERRLLAAGWEHQQIHPYDQRYYREWMHEIPPLRHWERQIEVDLHHRILPRTSRLVSKPALLWEASLPVAPRLRALAPADLVLHCAAHLFYDGEIKGGFRDLLDLHQMLVHYGCSDPGFWGVLIERARLLDLGRPLYYAVQFCRELLDTPVPTQVQDSLTVWAPPPVAAVLMRLLVRRVLPPRDIGTRAPLLSEWLLYIRSHWLRMPPWLLAKHLLRKALRRLTKRVSTQPAAE